MAATDGESDPHAAGLRLLWEAPEPPQRGPKPTLTLTAIAQAGITLADADGLAAVTMQSTAAALGVTKMALYRYLPGKVELVALMTETAMGAAPRLDTGSGGWRAKLHEWTRRLFAGFVRHPWLAATTTGPRALGPLELDWTEQAVAALVGTGLRGAEIFDVVATLAGHARTMAEHAAAATAAGGGTPEQGLAGAMSALLQGREDRFPALTATLAAAASEGGQDNALDFGVGRILDGVELLVADRAQDTSADRQ